jgi:YhcH/YjgK/YiaL family protein
MILDKVENIALYKNLGERLNQAITFIQSNNLSVFELGKHEINGDDIFVMVQEYETKDILEGKMETHKKYIDIQLMLSGSEMIGYDVLTNQIPAIPYNAEKEVMFFDNNNAFMLQLKAGQFAIFYPWDIHMPGIKEGEVKKVKKAVFKILFE